MPTYVMDPYARGACNATVTIRAKTRLSDGAGGATVTARPDEMTGLPALWTTPDAKTLELHGLTLNEVQHSVLLPVSVDGVAVPVSLDRVIVIETPAASVGKALYPIRAMPPQIGLASSAGRFVWYLCAENA